MPPIAGLAPATFAAVAAMTFGAAMVRGFTGFGMAIILVPLLGMVIPPGHAVVLAIILQLMIGPVGLPAIMADADRSTAIPIALLATLATPLGMAALSATPSEYARVGIALVAIGAFVAVIVPAGPRRPPSRGSTLMTGVASGVLTGFAAMPGPPVVPYYMRRAEGPRQARASMMLIFFATAVAGTLAALVRGLATAEEFLLAAFLFLPMIAGNWLGGRFFGRIPAPVWRVGVGLVLGASAVSAAIRLLSA